MGKGVGLRVGDSVGDAVGDALGDVLGDTLGNTLGDAVGMRRKLGSTIFPSQHQKQMDPIEFPYSRNAPKQFTSGSDSQQPRRLLQTPSTAISLQLISGYGGPSEGDADGKLVDGETEGAFVGAIDVEGGSDGDEVEGADDGAPEGNSDVVGEVEGSDDGPPEGNSDVVGLPVGVKDTVGKKDREGCPLGSSDGKAEGKEDGESVPMKIPGLQHQKQICPRIMGKTSKMRWQETSSKWLSSQHPVSGQYSDG